MLKAFKTVLISVAFGLLTFGLRTEDVEVPRVTVIETKTEEVTIPEVKIINKPVELTSSCIIDEEPEVIEEELLTREEIELIALVTMAEAEGESEQGKRLVIDTILNRVDHERFPDTVREVIYQPHQFTSMTNGRVDRCYVSDDICRLVEEELQSRTNNEVMFFTAGKYGKYGTPMFQVENHYFSSYA